MPIDFPNNPSAGQTYSYSGQQWIYNGTAWDKIVTADDAQKLVGVCGDYYAWNLPTGILIGGGITAAIGGSTFTVYAGEGVVVGLTGDDPIDFTHTRVKWSEFTGITPTYLASSQFTYLSIDSSGNLQQQTTDFSDNQWTDSIILGTLCHIDNASINLVTNEQNTAYGIPNKLDELIEVFGPMKRSGLRVYGYTAGSLQLARTGGTIFKTGSNYTIDQFEPDIKTLDESIPSATCRVYGNNSVGFTFDTNSGAFYTNIDPTKYDNNGVLDTVNNNEWSIQRMFLFASNPNDIICYYGPAKYNSFQNARDGYESEVFEEADITQQNAVYLGNLYVRGGAANLTSTSDAFFIQSGFARGVAGGGGGGGLAISLNDLTNVSITGVTTGQVLYYDGSFWVNQTVSFSGGESVSSLNGLTGAVGITNGSGIGLSVSGNTLTVSNTGVLSVNGSTGAITNVAKTNAANTFNQTQSIEGSGALGTSYLAEYGGSGVTFNFDTGIDTGSQRWAAGLAGGSNTTITFPNDTGTLALTKNVVSSVRGITGAVGITNGSGIGLSVSGNTLTVSNTGVLSIDGSTGTITNVARTNVDNNFTASQSISAFGGNLTVTDTDTMGTVTLDTSAVSFLDPFDSGTILGLGSVPAFTTAIVTLPAYTTTLAGLTGTQTFTGTNTFSSLANFITGISSAGGTFSALTRFTAGISASGITIGNGGDINLVGVSAAQSSTISQLGTGLYISSNTPISIYNSSADSFLSLNSSGAFLNSLNPVYIGDGENQNANTYLSVDDSTQAISTNNVLSFTMNPGTVLPSSSFTINASENIIGDQPGDISNAYIAVSNINNVVELFAANIDSYGLMTMHSGLCASGGMTLAGYLQGSTANFIGLVSSTVGFSGAATNLTGNATGLTAGTATKIIATSTNSASTFYPTFVGGAGNTGLFIDPTIGPLSYVPSTATLNLSNLNFSAGSLTMNAFEVSASSYFYFVASNGIYFQDPTLISMGDVGATAGKTLFEVYPTTGTRYACLYNSDFANNATLMVNRNTPVGTHAFEVNRSDGKAVKLIYNDTGGAATNYVNLDVSSSGDLTVTPSGGDVTVVGDLYANNIVNSFNGFTGAVTGVTTGTANTFGPLQSFTNGISAAGGTFSSPIRIPKLPNLTSAVFESKTTNWTPTDADDGKIFVVAIGGKSTITCTLNGLSVGVRFKILLQSGNVAFSVTGTGYGSTITFGMSAVASTTVYCTASNVYFATDSG